MEQIHHLLSGFKAIFSEDYVNVTETVRKTCGGAGFSSFSGFAALYVNHVPIPTYEGDNVVMLGQACKYLMKLIKKASSNTLPYPFGYINKMNETLKIKGKGVTIEDCLDINVLELGV